MNNPSRPATLLATSLAAAALLTACTSSGSGTAAPIATAARPARTAATSRGSAGPVKKTDKQLYIDSQRAFVHCMRAAGYDLPDPDPKTGAVNAETLKTHLPLPPELQASLERCSKLELPPPPVPVPPEELAAGRKGARCMRANGVPGYPDPAPADNTPRAAEVFRIISRLAGTPAYVHATLVCDGEDLNDPNAAG